MEGGRGGGGYVSSSSEFQIRSFGILRRRLCPCRYLTHLCVVCHHFICLMSLFQGHAARRNLSQNRIDYMPERKPHRIGLLLSLEGGDFGAISVTERSCAAPISKV